MPVFTFYHFMLSVRISVVLTFSKYYSRIRRLSLLKLLECLNLKISSLKHFLVCRSVSYLNRLNFLVGLLIKVPRKVQETVSFRRTL